MRRLPLRSFHCAAAAEAARVGALNLSAEQLELCARADYILVDPSCSGSGIVTRLDSIIDGAIAESDAAHACRLRRLSGFQLRLVLHALSFERVRRVVYSTCSAFREENECVVLDALLRSASECESDSGSFALVRPTDPSFAPFLSPLRAPPLPLPVASAAARQKEASEGQEKVSRLLLRRAAAASSALVRDAGFTLLRFGRTPASS